MDIKWWVASFVPGYFLVAPEVLADAQGAEASILIPGLQSGGNTCPRTTKRPVPRFTIRTCWKQSFQGVSFFGLGPQMVVFL